MIKYLTLAIGIASASAYATSTVGNMSEIPDTGTDAKKGFHGQVGVGVASLPEYVGGDETEGVGLPLINVSYNDRFYFKFNKLGAWVFKSDGGFRVGGVVTTHAGFDDDDLPDKFQGYGDRENSMMAGVNMEFKQGRFSTEVGYLTDVSDESEGSKMYAQVGYTFLANRTYTLTAIGKIESLDEDMVGYYYGNNESTTNATLGLVGTYKFSNQWAMIGAVTATSLGDEIGDSAIVEEDSYNMALVGVTYSF